MTRCASARVRVVTWQGEPATRPGGDHDTALYAPQHDAQPTLCSLPGCSARLVRVGWVQGVHLVHQPSFDPVHYSESLFGTLFMRFSKKKSNKIKSNEIKSFKMKFSKIKFFLLKMI